MLSIVLRIALLQTRRRMVYDCNMEPLDKLRQTLQTAGQSLTKPRQVVFKALLHQEPLTMHELVARCHQVDRASVYRGVALFEHLGIVQRLQTGWKYKVELTSPFHLHHHHVTCLICGRTVVIPEDATVEQHLRTLARNVGFQLTRHQLELQGYCTGCQALLQD
jgi:Fur family ferric uptake transcriptional regulator